MVCLVGQIVQHCHKKRGWGEAITWCTYFMTLARLGGGLRLLEVKAGTVEVLTITIPLDVNQATLLGQAVDTGRKAFEAAPEEERERGLVRLERIVLEGQAAVHSIGEAGVVKALGYNAGVAMLFGACERAEAAAAAVAAMLIRNGTDVDCRDRDVRARSRQDRERERGSARLGCRSPGHAAPQSAQPPVPPAAPPRDARSGTRR